VDEVVFGRYRLQSLLGKGGMGNVYLSHDTLMDRDVAVKVLPAELSTDPGYRERFRREAQTSARLQEPHIIPIHDTGEIDGQLYLVMPVVDGVDMQGLIKRDGPMSPQRAVLMIEQLAAALDAAHAAGLIHRDIKPSNALITGRDFVYLIDFGIAHDAAAPKLTSTGRVFGSWAYMAPERFTAQGAGPSADIYSLTCVLYECLTGKQPYPGNSIEQQFAGHYTEDPPEPSRVNPAVPAGFGEVIARGMAKNPEERFKSANDLAVAARQALTAAPAPNPDTAPTMLDPAQPPPGPTRASTQPVLGPTMADSTPLPLERTLLDSSQPPPGPTRADSTSFQGPTLLDSSQPPPGLTAIGDLSRRLPRSSDAVRPLTGGLNSAATQQRPAVRPPPPPRPADRLPAPTDTPQPSRRRRRWPLVAAAAVILLAASAALVGYLRPPSPVSQNPTAQPVVPTGQASAPVGQTAQQPTPVTGQTVAPSAAGEQTQLPFTGLTGPSGLAVDGAGDVYVADAGNSRMLELAVGSNSPTTMPFTGLGNPSGVAVGSAGDVYVTSTANNRVLKLAAGSSSTTELPFTNLTGPRGVATDSSGAVYVSGGANTVLKLAAGSSNTTEPPFTGLSNPGGVAVDGAGDVYVADSGNNRVVKLAAGAAAPTMLPFTGLSNPGGVAVDGAGDVFVADSGNNRVVKLAAGAAAPTVLPFTGLNNPGGVAADGAGQVYVTDTANNRVLKLAAG
jgi:serine/threonine-protein kinase